MSPGVQEPACYDDVSFEDARGIGAWRRLTHAVARSVVFSSALALAGSLPLVASAASTDYEARVERVLKQTPLIDGHNDLPWEIRERFQSRLSGLDLKSDTSKLTPPADSAPLMTDIARMHAGHMGGQFWSVWVPVSLKGFEAVQTTIEQIDLVKSVSHAALPGGSRDMAFTAAEAVRRIHHAGKIACMIGIEGGNQIQQFIARATPDCTISAPATHDVDSCSEHRMGGCGHGFACASRTDAFRSGGGPGDESPRHAHRPEPRSASGHHEGASVGERGPGHLFPLICARVGRSPARCPRLDIGLTLVARSMAEWLWSTSRRSTSRLPVTQWEADRAAEQARYNTPALRRSLHRSAR